MYNCHWTNSDLHVYNFQLNIHPLTWEHSRNLRLSHSTLNPKHVAALKAEETNQEDCKRGIDTTFNIARIVARIIPTWRCVVIIRTFVNHTMIMLPIIVGNFAQCKTWITGKPPSNATWHRIHAATVGVVFTILAQLVPSVAEPHKHGEADDTHKNQIGHNTCEPKSCKHTMMRWCGHEYFQSHAAVT